MSKWVYLNERMQLWGNESLNQKSNLRSCTCDIKVKPVKCKWAFKIKYNNDDTANGYEARLVVKRFTQIYGIDYRETFLPVTKSKTARIIFSIPINLDWEQHQLGVKYAFSNKDL